MTASGDDGSMVCLGAGLDGGVPLRLVDVGDDGLYAQHGLGHAHAGQADAAGADDEQLAAAGERGLGLHQRAVGRDARAGVSAGLGFIEVAEIDEIARIRHQDMRGIAAVAIDAQRPRLVAHMLVARGAQAARAAADPGIDDTALPDLGALDGGHVRAPWQ